MKVWLIILLVYVALDILVGAYIYIHLRVNGWSRYELARRFKMLMKYDSEEYEETMADEYRQIEENWE